MLLIPTAYTLKQRGSLDELKSSAAGGMYCPSSFVSSGTSHSCQRNWAKGYYTQSSELEEEAMDVVRRLAEDCDSLQGFLMLHSAGGGTGGGLGSRLLTHLGDEYPDRIVATQSLLPSAWVSESWTYGIPTTKHMTEVL